MSVLERLDAARPRFSSRLRSPEVAARVGVWLGICFAVAFLTGVWSHLYQDQPSWLTIPSSPVWLYRATQGLHVIAGTAAVPLLLVKLYAVYPKLFELPVLRRGARLATWALEKASIAVLVASAVFLLVTGLVNVTQWYPWAFSFRPTHFALAWIAIGALVLHIAVKLPVIRDALGRPADTEPDGTPVDTPDGSLSRRSLVRTALAASGVTVLAVAGDTVPGLRRISVFATHSGDGPNGLPINRSAREADVTTLALDPTYALDVVGPGGTVRLTRADLEAMPQSTERLPIACVEGWSFAADWTGVPLRDLLDLVDVPAGATVRCVSLEPDGPFDSSELRGSWTDDRRTLVALRVDGEPLAVDHGFPCRLIAPNRPGVLQTKWLSSVEVVA